MQTLIRKDLCSPMFIAALSGIPSRGNTISAQNKRLNKYIVNYIPKDILNKLLNNTKQCFLGQKWMDLEVIKLNEISQKRTGQLHRGFGKWSVKHMYIQS